MAWKLHVWAALVAYACAQLTCPSTSGTCDVNCHGAIPSCTGSLDCSTNAACTLTCNETGCANTVVTGLYTPDAGDYVLTCNGGCSFSTFTTRPTGTSRFLCSGNGCYDATINCRSPNCHLVCNGGGGCASTVLRCAGGPGSTCNIECNGGCDNVLNVTCEKYPCAVTITGNETNVLPICPGQQLCGDGSCVSATATSCGAVAEEVEGTSLVIETYSDNSCTGSPISTDSFDTGKCLNGKPGPGSFSYSRCTNLHYCQASGLGTCGGITLFCSPNQPTNVCQGGKKYVCSGAGQLGVGLLSAVAIALATLLL